MVNKEKRKQYQKTYYNKNRERLLAQKKIYGQIPRNKILKRDWNRTYRANHKEKYTLYSKNKRLNKIYGIGIEEYNNLLLLQNETCAICKENKQKYPLAVDHCHNTNKIRGLLCTKCNTFLGLYEKNIEKIDKFINYIKGQND